METDLFDFAYVPDWYGQLDELSKLALPEPWRFKKPIYKTKNEDTPILERYIHIIFRKQSIDFNSERDTRKAADYFHVENESACFHTGLYTSRYKGIYACFDRNHKKASMKDWYFRGFCDELSPFLKYVQLLPKSPSYYMAQVLDRAGLSGSTWNIYWEIQKIWSAFRRKSVKPGICRFYLKRQWNLAGESQ